MIVSASSLPRLAFTAAFLVSVVASTSHAAVIVTPVGATSSLAELSNRPITDAIDGSGLDSLGLSGNILSETHDNMGANDGPYFLAPNATVLTFDLGGSADINAIHIWNYTRTGEQDRGVRNFSIFTSTNGVDFSASGVTFTDFDVVPYTGVTQRVSVQSRSLSATLSGITHIQFQSLTNHGDTTYTGFGEIRFGAVPEPSAALLGGLGALLLLRRRR